MRMKNISRKVAANVLLGLFISSRVADVSATVVFSENLKHEGNEFVFALGGDWWSVAFLTFIFCAVFLQLWWKLRTHKYKKSTGLISKVINPGSAKKQIRRDLIAALSMTIMGFMAAALWVLNFGLKVTWLIWLPSLSMGPIDGTLIFIALSSIILALFVVFIAGSEEKIFLRHSQNI